MKQSLLIIVVFALLTSCNSDKKTEEQFTINGTLTGDYDDFVYLSYPKFKDSTYTVKDSAKVNNGKFSFQGKVDFPVQGWLNLKPSSGISWIYLENSPINISGKYVSQGEADAAFRTIDSLSIVGSKSQTLTENYTEFYQTNQNKANFEVIRYEEIKRIALANPQNSVSGKILSDAAISTSNLSYKQIEEIYALIDTMYQSTDDLKLINMTLSRLKTLAKGNLIIDFELPDTTSNLLSTTIFRGKTTLIDFWASWCVPCRKKHPEYKKLFKNYKDINFDIFSVSLDTDKDAWTTAIVADSLTWRNAIDIKGWEGQIAKDYSIFAIPFNILVNENGEIIELNASVEKIKELLEIKKNTN